MKYVFGLLLLIFSLPQEGFCRKFMQNPYGRQIQSLNGRWEALVDLYSRGTKMKVYQNRQAVKNTDFVEYQFIDGIGLDVPRDWNSQREELRYYESSVWYKRDFDLETKPGRRYFIYFGAANYRADVYLNGEPLGSHEGGFTPFQFEITESAKPTGNCLVVHVNSRRDARSIPALEYDWWNYGGLTRDVLLIETPDNFIDDYTVRLTGGSLTEITANVRLSAATEGVRVTVSIPELSLSVSALTDADGNADIRMRSKKLNLWSPVSPKLYDVKIATVHETLTDRIGFRSIGVRGNRIVLNGESVFLRGVNCHDEIPMRKGRAYSEMDFGMLLEEVKSLNCNFLRCTHYPPDERLVRMAEEMGLMLWEEIPQWQQIDFSNPSTVALAADMMSDLIRRDKNRCGVILWSVANETPVTSDRNRVLSDLIDMVRASDPSRLVTMATDKLYYDQSRNSVISNDSLCLKLDVVSGNKYFGWYASWPADPGSLAWDVFTDKPFIYSEFGGESQYGVHGDKDIASSWSEDYQCDLYKDHIRFFENIPNLSGTAPWVLFDFRSPYRMNMRFQQEWNRKGLLSENGFRKKSWYVMKEYYDRISIGR